MNLPSIALHTDLYQLTMAEGYWKLGMHNRKAAFNLFYRKNPFEGAYAISCGLEDIVSYITKYRFTEQEIQYLSSLTASNNLPLFDQSFLKVLKEIELEVDIEAIPEGTIVFPNEPLVQVRGPIMHCQLLETALLNLVNFPTLIATKASRVMLAAKGDQIIEFGMRRAQGVDGAITATRASFVGGVTSTSNTSAGFIYRIPVKGTHAHSWVMAFDDELEAFEAYAKVMPHNSVFLVDTYSTIEGVKHAIEVGTKLKAAGHRFMGIRLDSGDLIKLSILSRKMLDEAGFHDTQIMASGDLDEYEIERVKAGGSKISIWGVGTRMVTAYDNPALGGVYKLVAIQDEKGHWMNKSKRSDDIAKETMPGRIRARRYTKEGKFQHDILYSIEQQEALDLLDNSNCEDLLRPIFKAGHLDYRLPSLKEIQARTIKQLECLPDEYKLLKPNKQYPVQLFNISTPSEKMDLK